MFNGNIFQIIMCLHILIKILVNNKINEYQIILNDSFLGQHRVLIIIVFRCISKYYITFTLVYLWNIKFIEGGNVFESNI